MTMNVGTPAWHGTLLLLAVAASSACGASGGGGGSGGSSASGGASGGSGPTGGTGAVTAMLPTCEDLPDCGGDPSGTWDVTGACLSVLGNPYDRAGCEDALVGATLDASGSYTFGASTVSFSLDLVVHHQLSISDYCASATYQTSVRAADKCLDLELGYNSEDDVSEAICSVLDSRCVCDITFEPQQGSGSSPITIQDGQFVDAGGNETDFCVEGDELTLYFALGSTPPAPGDTGIELFLSRR